LQYLDLNQHLVPNLLVVKQLTIIHKILNIKGYSVLQIYKHTAQSIFLQETQIPTLNTGWQWLTTFVNTFTPHAEYLKHQNCKCLLTELIPFTDFMQSLNYGIQILQPNLIFYHLLQPNLIFYHLIPTFTFSNISFCLFTKKKSSTLSNIHLHSFLNLWLLQRQSHLLH
jgi:hypothetical protein